MVSFQDARDEAMEDDEAMEVRSSNNRHDIKFF